jgi:uncharacterized membrane protein
MHAELLVLRIIHILGGIIWVGTALFSATFLMPAIGMAGPAGGAVITALGKRGMFKTIPIVAGITILAGLRLMMIDSAGFTAAYFQSGSGLVFTIGGAFGIAALMFFTLVGTPAFARSALIGQQMAQASEAARGKLQTELNALRARGKFASQTSAILLVFASIAMAIGRYV